MITCEALYTCSICGELRGDMCPTCWRNGVLPMVQKLKNSDGFLQQLDATWKKTFEESKK